MSVGNGELSSRHAVLRACLPDLLQKKKTKQFHTTFSLDRPAANMRQRSSLFIALLPACHHQSPLFFPHTLFCARRFNGSSPRRSPTYSEVAEACDVLGVEADCDQRQLKKIYRDLVRKYHPDAGGDETTMSRITVAYDRLNGMSRLEKEQFKVQRNSYRGGSYYASGVGSNNNSSGVNGGHRYATPSGSSQYNTRAGYGNGSFYDSTRGDFFHQGPTRSQGYYAYQRQRQSYSENPFSSAHPFAFHSQLRRAWSMPLSSILLRGFVMYLGLSIVLLLVYRQYRDWLHDDGWKMSESLARHEQLSELHRVRQEMNERIRAAREAAAARNANFRSFVHHDESPTDYNSVTSSKGQELQALRYARHRQMEMGGEIKGWPQFNEEKGKLIRRAHDPPGVIFFEPRKEDLRYRQVRSMHVGRELSDRKQGVNVTDRKENSNGVEADTAVQSVHSSSNNNNEPDAISSLKRIFGDLSDGGKKTT